MQQGSQVEEKKKQANVGHGRTGTIASAQPSEIGDGMGRAAGRPPPPGLLEGLQKRCDDDERMHPAALHCRLHLFFSLPLLPYTVDLSVRMRRRHYCTSFQQDAAHPSRHDEADGSLDRTTNSWAWPYGKYGNAPSYS